LKRKPEQPCCLRRTAPLTVSPNLFPAMHCPHPPLATTWCHVGHWMKRGTHPRLEMDAPGPPCAESWL